MTISACGRLVKTTKAAKEHPELAHAIQDHDAAKPPRSCASTWDVPRGA
jgi:hypothetical protein